jgi:hypothetical protein
VSLAKGAPFSSLAAQLICPSGSFAAPLSSPYRKNIPIVRIFGLSYITPVPPHQKGRIMIVANAGRDAVDAEGAFDEWRRKRTAKTCGPGTPTLVSSSREGTRMTVANKPGAPGRARSSRKTIAWGMPGDSGVTCQRVCALPTTIAHTAIGRIGRPAFPAPSMERAGIKEYLAQKKSCGENAKLCLPFEVGESTQHTCHARA